MACQRLRLVLQDALNRNITDVVELANVCGYARSTVYSWLAEDGKDPRLDAVISWVTLHPNRRLREELAGVLCGQQVVLADVDDDMLDLNNDGTIDARDALRSAIESVDLVAQVLREVSEAARLKRLSEADAANAISAIHATQYQLMITELALARSIKKRKQAKR